MRRAGLAVVGCLVTLILLSGCRTTYYAMWEKMGKEKRHLLRDQVEKAQTEQARASKQFEDVADLIREMYGFEGGELEAYYNKLSDQYEACEERAGKVGDRIWQVEKVADDLFKEWDFEIRQIQNKRFKTQSRQALEDTQKRYEIMHASMLTAEAKMKPVLGNLYDYVLFLKHNLNARAIGALKQEMLDIESEVESLIDDIGESVFQADQFLKTLEQ
jgi:Protein of unknown function (DUF2959)